eukprot:CAMPEP_0201579610 /NCGR_PEP_ID=MMETSP0190_2-20130828/27329_1 /ASSEMBLY_ACC=CAM_ASM_000263 /TAXON_ID=37353 /ORGANISM="Rosalina sp." /LENGTH=50 /DNA_ID=CAMNT_0048014303 /DNA_START=14 /DNA_END=163 /DNA_ORIENTATION=-
MAQPPVYAQPQQQVIYVDQYGNPIQQQVQQPQQVVYVTQQPQQAQQPQQQ